jgi:hypothetical protein
MRLEAKCLLVAPNPFGGRTIEIELGNQSVGSPLTRGVRWRPRRL